MSFLSVINHLKQLQKLPGPSQYLIQNCGYAALGSMGKAGKKSKKPMTSTVKKIEFPVEKDSKKLVSFVCGSNILKEGGQDIELKADSEYPDWLWNIRIGPSQKLEDLDPNTKAYWRKLRKQHCKMNNLKSKNRRF